MILAISKKIVIPYNMYVFSILPFMFLWYLTYIHLLLSTFFHIIFYFMLYVCIFCTNQLQYITLVHIQLCTVYVIYIRYLYIWDIYISINFYCDIHLTSCSYCHPKNLTQVHHWYMSWNESIWHMFCNITFVFGNFHTYSQSTFGSSASSISLWKLYITTCLLILWKLLFGVILTGIFVILCNVAFDGVLDSVMGTVCCIVFRILSSFLDFIWDGILGMTTCGSNSYFNFSR